MSMATSLPQEIDRKTTVPFHLKLFYKTGTFNRIDEFQAGSSPLPPHIHISTWLNCTLRELSHHVAANLPDLLPSPPVGTRLVFRLVFPDTKFSHAHFQGPGRFMTKHLGSIIIGTGTPSTQTSYSANAFNNENDNPNYDNRDAREYDNEDDKSADGREWLTDTQKEMVKGGLLSGDGDGTPEKSLQDVRFVIGDYIDCAILPPLSNGDIPPSPDPIINPLSNMSSGPTPVYSLSGAGGGHNRVRSGGGANEFVHPSRAGLVGGGIGSGRGGSGSWRSGRGSYGGGRGGGTGGPRQNGFGGFRTNDGGLRGGDIGAGGSGNAGYGMGSNEVPIGEWRRGERLPDTSNRGGRDYRGGTGGRRW